MFGKLQKENPDYEPTSMSGQSFKKMTPQTPVIESSSLFAGMKQVLISHAGEVYRLRITRNGKLILNK
jgi:hemin uptake protein HemP